MKENTQKGKWKKPLLITAVVLLVLVLAAVLTVAIAGSYILDKLGSAAPSEPIVVIPPEQEDFETDPPETTEEPTTEPTESGTQNTEDADSTQPTTQPPATTQPQTRPAFTWPEVERLQSEDVINILLIGKDASKPNERPRSDSMILLSINKKTNALTLTSFMRDLYVQIPGGYSDNRINAAFRFGGAPLLNATIEKNFGIVIDGNVEVDFNQFSNIVQILGGVDVELTAAEASYLNKCGYTDVTPGKNHLYGAATLTYCRIRKIDSDHYRTERQRKVLMSIAESARNMSASQMMDLINQVLPHVYTDLSDSEIISIATAAIKALSSGAGIQSGKVPQGGQYYGSMIMGMQVIVPDLVQCNQYLKAFIYGG